MSEKKKRRVWHWATCVGSTGRGVHVGCVKRKNGGFDIGVHVDCVSAG